MTRQEAIRAKCLDCIYDPLEVGTNLAQVERCTMSDCSLYLYRPIPKSSKPKPALQTEAQLRHMANMREAKKL